MIILLTKSNKELPLFAGPEFTQNEEEDIHLCTFKIRNDKISLDAIVTMYESDEFSSFKIVTEQGISSGYEYDNLYQVSEVTENGQTIVTVSLSTSLKSLKVKLGVE